MLINTVFRIAYRIAYRLMCLYWRIARVHTHGALVAIWHQGRILVSRNSYVDYYCVPGGYLKFNETAAQAAVREIAEELGLAIDVQDLSFGHEETHEWAGKVDHVVIFDLNVASCPPYRVDMREVLSAEFVTKESALALNLFPPLRRHIERKMAPKLST